MSECFVQLSGSLGSQLFQVAAAYAHCERQGLRLRVSMNQSQRYWHSFLHTVTDKRGGQNRGPTWNGTVTYSEIPFNALNLMGAFQSSKYFTGYEAPLRALFDPGAAIQETVTTKYAALPSTKSIVLHYSPDTESLYYERAIAQMRAVNPGAALIVVSASNKPGLSESDAVFIEEEDESIALHLMRQFRYHILSTDPISWWGAWLSVQKPAYVIAPRSGAAYESEPTWDRM